MITHQFNKLINSTGKEDIADNFNILKYNFYVVERLRFRMMRIKYFLLFLCITTIFYSCNTNSGIAVDNYDVVITFYDDLASFSTIRQYRMPDSVVVIFDSNSSSAGSVTHEYDSLILNEVEKQFDLVGYEREFSPSQNPPDIIVLVSVVVSDRYSATRAYDLYEYWSWYTGWTILPNWGSGWSVNYPWQQNDVTYNYSIGSLIIMMLDARDVNSSEKTIPNIWSGVMNGLLVNDPAFAHFRILDNISQCFVQSPYLVVNSD